MTADQLLQKLREAQRRVALENPNPKSAKEFNEMIDLSFIPLLQQFENEIREEDAKLCEDKNDEIYDGFDAASAIRAKKGA
jgi:predicted rRNA methylase YqxC with S4 and FtsJ domains